MEAPLSRTALFITTIAACNTAPMDPPEHLSEFGYPTSHPTDALCKSKADAVEVDGFLLCNIEAAASHIAASDDPILASCGQTELPRPTMVFWAFDGETARAYPTDFMFHTEVVHETWGGVPVAVAYCPKVEGGEVYLRQMDGEVFHLDAAGMWGNANVVTERELTATGQNTLYTTWDNHGLVGPGRKLREFPALTGLSTLGAFLDHHDLPGVDCQVWTGEDRLKQQAADDHESLCSAACDNQAAMCGADPQTCLDRCDALTDDALQCVLEMDICDQTCAG